MFNQSDFVISIMCFASCLLTGVYSWGTSKSSGDSHHPYLLSEEEVSRDHWFLQELHRGGGWGRRHLLFCPDGHQTAWASCGEGRCHRWRHICRHVLMYKLCGMQNIDFVFDLGCVVDVRGEDGGLYIPAGRGREDRVITDALRNHQPPLAASSGDHALHQPVER